MPDNPSAVGAEPRFSIIIPAYNAEGTLRWCLEGVLAQGADDSFEVIVVESGDPSYVRLLAEDFPDITFLLPPGRLYSGQARNVGARFARGQLLVFLDCDCRPLPGWLAAHSSWHERGYAVVCGALENGTGDSLVGTAEHLISHADCAPQTPPREIEGATASSGNLSTRRDVFEAHGGFGETLRAVDFALSAKLDATGTKVRFCPQAVVLHMNTISGRAFLREQMQRGYWAAVSRIRFGSKGSVVAKFPPLAFPLFFLRFYRFLRRTVRYKMVAPRNLVEVMPLAAAGLLAWTWGFFRGSLATTRVQPEEGEALPSGFEGFEVLRGAEGTGPKGEGRPAAGEAL